MTAEPRTLTLPPHNEQHTPEHDSELEILFDALVSYDIEQRDGAILLWNRRDCYEESDRNMRWYCRWCSGEWPCEPPEGTYWDNLDYE